MRMKIHCIFILSVLLVSCAFAVQEAPKAQRAQVTVAVMPFWGSGVDRYSDLIATSARDGLINRLARDPDIRVVVRRRAYALSLDSEVIIDDPGQANYRTPADFVIFGQLVRAKTEGGSGYNIISSIYESRSAKLAKLHRIKCGKDDPEALA